MSADNYRPWHSMNQILGQAGAPPVMPEDWHSVDSLSDDIVEGHLASHDSLERFTGQYAQAFAAEIWRNMMQCWDAYGDLRGVEIPEDITRLEGAEPTVSTLWVVTMVTPYERIAIRDVADYIGVAEDKLAHMHVCQARISKRCEGSLSAVAAANGLRVPEVSPDEDSRAQTRASYQRSRVARQLIAMPNPVLPYTPRFFRFKRGHIIVVVKVCTVCRDFLAQHGPIEDAARQFGTVFWYPDPDLARAIADGSYPATRINRRVLRLPNPG